MILHDNVTVGQNGNLYFAGYDTAYLAKTYGTPAIFIDENRVRARLRLYRDSLQAAFGKDSMPLFASKALSFKELYRIVASENVGTDIVSAGELYTAVSAGFPMGKAFFHGNNKTDFDIRYAMENGIGYFIVDNEEELCAIDEIAGEFHKKQKILLRITPGIDSHTHRKISTGNVDSKFGSPILTGAAKRIVKLALEKENIDLCGYHCHIGSQIFDEAPYLLASSIMTEFMADIRDLCGYTPKIFNIGGGFGVRYVESDPQIDLAHMIHAVCERIKEDFQKYNLPLPTVLMEPGRSIVADSGMTLYTVGSVKEIEGYKNYVSVDGGMTDNPRYTLYQSAYTVLLSKNPTAVSEKRYTVGGRCCESGDILQENVPLCNPARGDILAVLVTGAYNYSMASNYNRVTRPPVILLSKDKETVAVRRENFEDLVACDL